ncbi:MAG: hypothetical protein U0517_01555 [Candidatus Andersenbacteria bacterium]
MPNRWKYSLCILAAFVDGLLFASVGTKITYQCPHPYDAGCVSFEKAIMHPADLVSNYQDSLSRFLLNFVVVFIVVLVLSIAVNTASAWAEKRKHHRATHH